MSEVRLSHSLGIEVVKYFEGEEVDGYFLPVLSRGAPLPATAKEPVFTVESGQRELEVRIFRGEYRRTDQNQYLGRLRVVDLPQAPAGQAVWIHFRVDENESVEVTARVAESDKSVLEPASATLPTSTLKRSLARLGSGGTPALGQVHKEDRALIDEAEQLVPQLDLESRRVFEVILDAFLASVTGGSRARVERSRQRLRLALAQLKEP